MKKKEQIVLWPVYFDSSKTRLESRRLPKRLAVAKPRLDEIRKAVERVGFQPEVVIDAGHPNVPWQKTGLIIIPKRGSKNETLRRVAKELLNIRLQTPISQKRPKKTFSAKFK